MRLPQAEPPHGEMLSRDDAHECVVCGHPVAVDRKFCTQCGAPQWEDCLKCQGPVSPKDRFCGGCGADLMRLAEQRRRELVEILEKAREYESAVRLEDALATYRQVAEVKQARFRKLADSAAERIEDLERRRERIQTESQTILASANELIEENRHADALARLQAVPLDCRTEEMTRTIDELERVEHEVARIEKEISQAVEQDRMHKALDALQELLTLRPAHPHGRALAQRLCDGMLSSVQAAMGEYDYATVRQVLESVPEPLRTDRLEEELDKARKLEWMTDELTRSSHVDKQLVTVAGLLYRATPQDPRVIWHCKKLKSTIVDFKNKPDWPRQPWDTSARSSVFGGPVQPVFALEGVEFDDSANLDLLASQADRFTTACGLALQGLGRALIPLNVITPPKRGGMLGWLGSKTSPEVWGIDCGRHALKAVRATLRGGDQGRVVVIQEAVYIPYGGGVDHTLKDSLQIDAMKRTMADFQKRYLQGDFGVSMSLPGSETLCRNFSLPEADPKKTAQAVELEAKHLLPGKLDQFRWRFVVTNRVGGKFGLHVPGTAGKKSSGSTGAVGLDERQNIFLVATRFDVLRKFMEALDKCGVRPNIVVPDAVANMNYFANRYALASSKEDDELGGLDESFIVCDMGTFGTNLIVYADRAIAHSFVGTGGSAFTKSVCRLRNMTFEQAEDFKRTANTVPDLTAMHDTWKPLADMWANDIRRRTEMMLGMDTAIATAHFVGGGFRLHGLIRHFRTDETDI